MGALISHRHALYGFAALREVLELPGDDAREAAGLIFLTGGPSERGRVRWNRN